MASLSLSVGPVSSSVTATDAKATEILRLFVAAYDGPTAGTNQQQADFVVARLRQHIVEVARGQNMRAKEIVAREEATTEASEIDW